MGNLLRDYGESNLRRIVRQAQRLLAMDKIFKECLPENIRPHCHLAQITATELTLLVDGAAWLTHLRYLKPQLLQQLKTHPQCAYLKEIQYRIQPAQKWGEKAEPAPVMRHLSTENKELLQSTAAMVSNPQLKKALLKLSA